VVDVDAAACAGEVAVGPGVADPDLPGRTLVRDGAFDLADPHCGPAFFDVAVPATPPKAQAVGRPVAVAGELVVLPAARANRAPRARPLSRPGSVNECE
jgi:hypothetical protein